MRHNTFTTYPTLTGFCVSLLLAATGTAMAGITLRLDGVDYAQMGSAHFTPADHTVHVTSQAGQQPLLCTPAGTPQGNAETILVLRLDSMNYPLSANAEITYVAGNTLITATSVDGVLVCNPNPNDPIYQSSFE